MSTPGSSGRDLLPTATARASARHVASLLRQHRLVGAGAVLAFLGASACGLVAPWVLGGLVDDILAGEDRLLRAGLLLAAAALGAGVLTVVAADLLARAVEPTLATLRGQVLERALDADTGVVEAAGAGDLLSRVGDDGRLVSTTVTQSVPDVLGALTTIALTSLGFFALDWRLGLAGLAAAPAFVGSLGWYLPRSAPYYARERVLMGERAQALVGALQGLATVRAYRLEEPMADEVDRRSEATMRVALDVFALFGRFAGRNNRAELIGVLVVLGTGFWLVDTGSASAGEVTTAALLFHRLFNPVGAVLYLFDELQSAAASLTRLVGVATMPPRGGDPEAPSAGSALVARGVGHAYRDQPVLHDVDLVVPPAGRVALVGATGAGKTTLGAITAGLLDPTEGGVRLGGVPLADLGRRQLRRHVALVSQEVHVFTGTVRDNLLLGLRPGRPDPSDDELLGLLERVRARRWAQDLPDGLDTRVGEDGHAVAAAQAQQLALARVLLADPAVVVLDEATAEAGSRGARELDAAAAEVLRDRASVVVAHRLSQARDADEIVVLDHGRVVERGRHADLVAAAGPYATAWAAWDAR